MFVCVTANKSNGITIKTSWVTTFTKVTNFTDFLEASMNNFFRFTRDIAQAWA